VLRRRAGLVLRRRACLLLLLLVVLLTGAWPGWLRSWEHRDDRDRVGASSARAISRLRSRPEDRARRRWQLPLRSDLADPSRG
jgi:hypothetical protein